MDNHAGFHTRVLKKAATIKNTTFRMHARNSFPKRWGSELDIFIFCRTINTIGSTPLPPKEGGSGQGITPIYSGEEH